MFKFQDLEWFVEQVLSSYDNTSHYRYRVSKHIQAKDESVKFKQGLVAIVFHRKFSKALSRLRLEFQVKQAESI